MVEKNVFQESFNGIAFEIRVVERSKITDKIIIHNPAEIRAFVQKYVGVI